MTFTCKSDKRKKLEAEEPGSETSFYIISQSCEDLIAGLGVASPGDMREQRGFHWVVRAFLSGSAQGCALDSIVAARVTSHHTRGATMQRCAADFQSLESILKIIHSRHLFSCNNLALLLFPLAYRQPL